jgi:3-hydroxyisobutyrate dehydrogenase-like beta-hydroxyacid dehydrogenase
MPNIAFIGLGNMGIGMARNVAAAGWPLKIWNRSAGKAAAVTGDNVTVAPSPAAAAEGADLVITMVADDGALEAVTLGTDGLLSGLGADAVHISSSTVSVRATRALAERHGEAGRAFLAAPVFGRPAAAEAAKLWVCAGGPADLVERCRPVLECMGQGIVHVGLAPEQASAFKLAGNFLIGSMLEALCEAFTLLRKHGIDPLPFQALMSKGLFRSPVYESYGDLALSERFDPPGFRLALGLKDMTLAQQAAQDSLTPMPGLAVVHANLLAAVAQGLGDLDMAAVIRVASANAGLSETGSS